MTNPTTEALKEYIKTVQSDWEILSAIAHEIATGAPDNIAAENVILRLGYPNRDHLKMALATLFGMLHDSKHDRESYVTAFTGAAAEALDEVAKCQPILRKLSAHTSLLHSSVSATASNLEAYFPNTEISPEQQSSPMPTGASSLDSGESTPTQ